MATILNVAPNTTILSAWGNSVTDELNQRTLKIDGKKSSDGSVMQMTGDLLLRNADPTNANHAVRKKYVDDKDALNLKLTGGTMTGAITINESDSTHCLMLRSQQTGTGGAFVNTPYMSFYNAQASTRFGYIQGTTGGLTIKADSGGINILSGTAGDIVLNSGGAQVRSSDGVWVTGGSRFYSASQAVIVAGADPYIGFYGAATSTDNLGTRSGYIGFYNGYLYVNNSGASSSNIYNTGYAHVFQVDATEVVKIISGEVMVGKSTAGLTNVGVELFESGTIYATHAAGGASPLYAARQGSADGEFMVSIIRSGTHIGRIEQEGTTGSKFVSGSDRRMKTIQGPITDAIARVKAMRPYRVSWNGDPSRGVTDAFIADEMQDIVPEAVSGTPNAVAGPPQTELDPPAGTPIYQGMSYEKLVTVTIAALQDVIGRVEALEAA